MVFMRTFFRGLILFVILISVALWAVAATLQTTLLNRSAMKMWVQESGAYENVIDTIEIRQIDATGIVTSEMLRLAIGKVITPDFIQNKTEVVIDAVYDWLQGDAPQIVYEIPIQERRVDFITHLGKLLEQKLQQLPACSGSVSLSQQCIPRAYTLETYAASIAKQTAEDSDLFEKPITSENTELLGALKQLPAIASMNQMAVWVLPIVIALGAVGYVALSQKWRIGIANLGKRFVFSSASLVVIGAIAWIFGGSLDLGARLFAGSDAALLAVVVEPILQQAIAAIGMWLTIFAGCFVLLGTVLWVIGYVLLRKQTDKISTSNAMSL